MITERLVQALPAAERYLDALASGVEAHAVISAPHPDRLLRLIRYARRWPELTPLRWR